MEKSKVRKDGKELGQKDGEEKKKKKTRQMPFLKAFGFVQRPYGNFERTVSIDPPSTSATFFVFVYLRSYYNHHAYDVNRRC
jgi:hypothetical protein